MISYWWYFIKTIDIFICIVELKNNDVEKITTNNVALIKRNICNAPTCVHSKLPNSISELHDFLCIYEIKISKQENILLMNDKPIYWSRFSKISNFELLCKVQHLYIDNSIKPCPNFFCSYLQFMNFIMKIM